jgi:hypothetical protein
MRTTSGTAFPSLATTLEFGWGSRFMWVAAMVSQSAAPFSTASLTDAGSSARAVWAEKLMTETKVTTPTLFIIPLS